jgi:hypothetical protein
MEEKLEIGQKCPDFEILADLGLDLKLPYFSDNQKFVV